MGPTIDALAKEYDGKAVIGKLNVYGDNGISRNYGVGGIPALLFFKDGEVVDRMIGGQPKADIAAKLDTLIGG